MIPLLLLILLIAAAPALAESGQEAAPTPRADADPAPRSWRKTDAGPAPWSWRKSSILEYTGIALAAAGTLYVENDNKKTVPAKWTARNDLDEGVRDLLRLEGKSARNAADTAGTALMGAMIAAPVIDSFATLGLRDRNWEALWQTSVINMESLVFTGLVSSVMQNTIGRERPFARTCRGGQCEETEPNRSMPSGHVAFAFTGAGLVCTHHSYQSLYGDPDYDRAACYTGMGLATATGLLRLLSDRHYFTDVAAGTVIGLFSGMVLPRLLHYSWPAPGAAGASNREPGAARQVTLSPLLLDGGAGLACELRF